MKTLLSSLSAFGLAIFTSARSAFAKQAGRRPSLISPLLIGRMRTTTRTASFDDGPPAPLACAMAGAERRERPETKPAQITLSVPELADESAKGAD